MGSKAGWWKAHLEAWRASGLSQAAYCHRHQLSLASFGYWRGKWRSASMLCAPSTPAMLPIVVATVPRSGDRIEVTLPNSVQAQIPVDMDSTRWVPMIRALMAC